jgi:glucoside 3-dehydrogenase (cytochrome c) hitch-hiker subunit
MSHEADSPEMIGRRALLRRAAWILGGTISAPAALAILQGCSAKEGAPAAVTLKFLTPDQFDVIAEIAQIMIPKTDTSGAKEAGVPAFIDIALDAVYDQEQKDRFNAGYATFNGGEPFLTLPAVERQAVVKQSLEAALAGERNPKPFILMVRELTLLGYFTSQPGITENMTYEAVPTAYHGCVPIAQMKTPVYWE